MAETSGLARRRLGPLALSLGGLWPGILLAAVIALAARYGAPAMLLALLLGAAFHHLAAEPRTAAGIAFSASALQRVGVALVSATILLGAGLAIL